MPNPYLSKIGPAIGGALPGLPRRASLRGEVTFAVPGTVNWTVPSGVFRISTVAVAAGGGSVFNGVANDDVSSGPGGATAWTNGINVTPGEIVVIDIGEGGKEADDSGATTAVGGGDSKVTVRGVIVCHAEGGNPGVIGSAATGGAVLVGDGGSGGDGAFFSGSGVANASGGAAGGYSGDGGDGVAGSGNTAGNSGDGGSGASGSIGAVGIAHGSGGTGLNGEGDSGVATISQPGTGGSDGQTGGTASAGDTAVGFPGVFGAGASVANANSATIQSKAVSGAGGGVRIIFGSGRAFPSTDTGQ